MLENAPFLTSANTTLARLTSEFSELADTLDRLGAAADARTASRAAGLKSRLQSFSPRITLVGQVKAGKSALTNVLAASPGLLPSDVNPWTSVVTTLAINTRAPADPTGPANTKARFTFFNRDEWDNLVVNGGRLGELAERAGAEDELIEIQRQIDTMRKTTEARLGKHFELLLGQNHSYGYVDHELVERYVCLGDGPDLSDAGAATGRFADITKSAEFYLDVPEYDFSMTLCDTPGVNDTFLIREQITLRSLRNSDLCVVVLSAHQALTTVDLALMRIISNLENRQIILFVNRIDELNDPMAQIPEIRAGIEQTLKKFNIGPDVAVIFGSAKWAEASLTASMRLLSPDSQHALTAYASSRPESKSESGWETMWNLSGVPDLLEAIGERVCEGTGKRQLERTRRSARNLANEARAKAVAARQPSRVVNIKLGEGGAAAAMRELSTRFETEVATLCQRLRDDLSQRMQTAEASFVKRATDSLVTYLEQHGEQGTWNYDPTGLRVLHRTAYASFSRALAAKVSTLYGEAASHVQGLYLVVLGDELADFSVEPPHPPRVPAPVGLGRTIALDLQSTWWRRWWQKRRGASAYAKDYAQLISAEVHAISKEIEDSQVAAVLENTRATLRDFLREHEETISRITNADASTDEKAEDPLAGFRSGGDANTTFSEILKGLEEMAA
ncbi:dynamin family protein [Defluviimonas salinarum]|uniref:Dynamin family protein n=1 Tax=Defluviimonas salinarum TaxID=2992147 RepID=A0ABT3J3Z5_9RHOB|nr:dynamin family protein [Defluviimonas salinarum]MCW3782398.1 dynamin family protein [Defluviimonas salinarum]